MYKVNGFMKEKREKLKIFYCFDGLQQATEEIERSVAKPEK
jgi:hypothetical protein